MANKKQLIFNQQEPNVNVQDTAGKLVAVYETQKDIQKLIAGKP